MLILAGDDRALAYVPIEAEGRESGVKVEVTQGPEIAVTAVSKPIGEPVGPGGYARVCDARC